MAQILWQRYQPWHVSMATQYVSTQRNVLTVDVMSQSKLIKSSRDTHKPTIHACPRRASVDTSTIEVE